jgi:hypothetical protein
VGKENITLGKRLDIRLEDTVSKLIQTEKMNQSCKNS